MKSLKALSIFTGILAFAVLASAFVNAHAFQDQKTEERELPSFRGFSVSVPADVYYTQDKTQRVILEGDPEDLKRIVTQVDGGVLKIFTRSFTFRWSGKIKITISSPEIRSMDLAGSGKIFAEQPVKTDELSVDLSGSGKIYLKQLSAKSFRGNISGSGNIWVAGGSESSEADFNISGSGDIHSEEFIAKVVSVKIAGSGNCYVQSVERLEGRIAGSGNLYYKGKPILDVVISGSGKARPL